MCIDGSEEGKGRNFNYPMGHLLPTIKLVIKGDRHKDKNASTIYYLHGNQNILYIILYSYYYWHTHLTPKKRLNHNTCIALCTKKLICTNWLESWSTLTKYFSEWGWSGIGGGATMCVHSVT